MTESTNRMRDLLRQVAAGDLSPVAAETALRRLAGTDPGDVGNAATTPPAPAADSLAQLGMFGTSTPVPAASDEAYLDFDREGRCGFPEIVFGETKTVEQMRAIVEAFAARQASVLITRVSAAAAAALSVDFPGAEHDPAARTWMRRHAPVPVRRGGSCGVITAGTSDIPVAREALNTLAYLGHPASLVADVGVAGLHRLLRRLPELRQHQVLIVVAGMEGALPSVVGGLVSCPVIAVPTSVGYGASFGGVSALLGMLNSCASGLTVTNIDAGFVAACAAARILGGREEINAATPSPSP